METGESLLKQSAVSSYCVLLVDEVHLQKSIQYHSWNFACQDEEEIGIKGCSFYHCILKAIYFFYCEIVPEVSISGEWLKQYINKWLISKTGFKVRALISDKHLQNANAFSHLLEILMETKELWKIA